MNIHDLPQGSYDIEQQGKGSPLNVNNLPQGSYQVEQPATPSEPQQPQSYSFFDPMRQQTQQLKQEGIDNPNPVMGALQYGAGRLGGLGLKATEFIGADKPLAYAGQKIASSILPNGLPQDYKPTTGLQAAGGAAETALTLAGGPLYKGAQILKGGVKAAALIAPGYAYDVSSKLAEGDTGAKIAMPGIGTAVGALGPIVNKAKSVFSKESQINKILTPELTTKATEAAIKTGKVLEGGVAKGRDITKSIPNFNKIKEALKEVPNITKGSMLDKANAVHDHIGNLAESLKSQLSNKGFFSPNEFSSFMKESSNKLKDIPSLTRDAHDVATKYLTQFDKLVKKNGYTPSGLLQARKEFDRLIPDKKLSPDIENGITQAIKVIRQGANDFIAKRVPDVAVKDLLSKQSRLYDAMDTISEKAAKEKGSKIGRLIQRYPKTAGAVGLGAGLVANKIAKQTTGVGIPYLP